MSRSLKVSKEYIPQVKLALKCHGYPRQIDLAEDLGISLSTVGHFLNGKYVDFLNFIEICQTLNLDWHKITDLNKQAPNDSLKKS